MVCNFVERPPRDFPSLNSERIRFNLLCGDCDLNTDLFAQYTSVNILPGEKSEQPSGPLHARFAFPDSSLLRIMQILL